MVNPQLIPAIVGALVLGGIVAYGVIMGVLNPINAVSVNSEELEQEIYKLVNEYRRQNGVKELAWDEALAEIARTHSQDMADNQFFSHTNPDGLDPTARGSLVGYRCYKDYGTYYTEGIAENILEHPRSIESTPAIAASAMTSWMESQGHRENILDSSYDRIGVGVGKTDGQMLYITQNFC